jgi:hypothetical protein
VLEFRRLRARTSDVMGSSFDCLVLENMRRWGSSFGVCEFEVQRRWARSSEFADQLSECVDSKFRVCVLEFSEVAGTNF